MKKMLMMAAVCLMAAMTFAAQCAATTKKGTQCKRQASPGSEFCWQHGGTTKAERATGGKTAPVQTRRTPRGETGAVVAPAADGRCQATTRKGAQCKRQAQAGGRFCAQHATMAGDAESAEPVARPVRRARHKAEPVAETVPAPAAEAGDGMCQGTTKSGEPCKRKAKPGSKFCWQHDK